MTIPKGLILTQANQTDAPRIADIHLAAFQHNSMLLAQFPTEKVRQGLRKTLADKAAAEIRDPRWEILVVRDQNGEIISFAKWCLPIPESMDYEEPAWNWPVGTMLGVLNEWAARVEVAGDAVLGRIPCYRLTFIGTDPEHERRGAASLLARWGLERSMSENVPIALESTMDAVPFYERLGFRPEAHISMPLHGLGKDGESVLYEEVCLVFRPSNFPSSVDPIPLGSSSLRCL